MPAAPHQNEARCWVDAATPLLARKIPDYAKVSSGRPSKNPLHLRKNIYFCGGGKKKSLKGGFCEFKGWVRHIKDAAEIENWSRTTVILWVGKICLIK